MTPEATAQRVDDADTSGLLLILLGGALGGLAAGVIRRGDRERTAPPGSHRVAGLLAVWGCYSFYVFYPAGDSGFPSDCSSSCPSLAILGLS